MLNIQLHCKRQHLYYIRNIIIIFRILYFVSFINVHVRDVGTKCVLRGNPDSEECVSARFQPFVFSTDGNSDCIYRKSLCEGKGLLIHHNGSSKDNRKCRCDIDCGYSFVSSPEDNSFCIPFQEDCSCLKNTSDESFIHFTGNRLIRVNRFYKHCLFNSEIVLLNFGITQSVYK